uniref:F-box domain-containing protein n=1 Tax=Oryza meridionalis TaxID=40149 RepID=A0A0E0FCS9_9ORYZ
MAKRRRCCEAQQAMAKKSSKLASTSAPCFLPDDVVGEVLLHLPSRSLARFRSWERLISSPAFVESHHALAAAPKLAFAPTAPPHRWNLFEDHGVRCRECPRVIGPKACRGLLLLGQRCTRTYSVCNPSTGGRLRLPPCLTGYPYFHSCAGIGFDERAGVHKVAVIAAPIELEWATRCEVITIGDPAGWRAPAGEGSSSSMPAASFLVQNMDPVLANGCLHWALRGASRVPENDDDSAVLSLSLAAESFRRLPLPPFAKDDVRRCFMDDSKPYPAANPRKPGYIKGTTPTGPVLAELGGRLCMLRDLRHRHDMDGTFEVYRLDDYDSGAWSLSYRVDLAGHAAQRLMTTWFVVPLC